MSTDLDITVPGPAGLYRFVSDLTEAGWQQEREARARLEKWCHACGQMAHFGFGGSLREVGVWSCSEPDCRSSAERQTREARNEAVR